MRRQFGDLQNLPRDLWSFGRFCGPQTVFAWDLDSLYSTLFLILGLSLYCKYFKIYKIWGLHPNFKDYQIQITNFSTQKKKIVKNWWQWERSPAHSCYGTWVFHFLNRLPWAKFLFSSVVLVVFSALDSTTVIMQILSCYIQIIFTHRKAYSLFRVQLVTVIQ